MPQTSADIATSDSSGADEISLVIPGRPEYVGLCRLVAGAAAIREALDEESIADLKLAVTEACTMFLYGPNGSRPGEIEEEEAASPSIHVLFEVLPEAWVITISDPEGKHRLAGLGGADAGTDSNLGLTIMNALVDSLEHMETGTGGSVIRLVKRFPQPAGSDI